jgi:Tol biopolymer transport system component
MLTDSTRISLADLSGAGVRLRAADAVTIVRELLLQVSRGELPGVPSAHVIRLTGGGAVVVEGPVAAGGGVVSRGAQLLDSLLPPFDATGELKVPGALRLVVARALGTLDLPAYASLEEFSAALDRFAEPDPRVTVRRLVEQPHVSSRISHAPASGEPSAPATDSHASRQSRVPETVLAEQRRALMRRDPSMLSISDIRRARRATGLSLSEIADRSRVPVSLLRQLEWGYLHNWPGGLYGRTQLVRYARAAGLDEQLVIATVWPLLDEVERDREVLFADEPVPAPAAVTTVQRAVATSEPPEPEVVVEAVEVRSGTPSKVALGEILFGPEDPPTPEAPPAPRRRAARRVVTAAGLVAAAAVATIMVVPGAQDQVARSLKQAATSQSEPAQSESTTAANQSPPPQSPPAQDLPAATSGNDTSDPTSEAVAAARRPESAAAPIVPSTGAEPVRGLTESETAWSPSFATVGSAMFYHAQNGRDGDSAVVRADTDSSGTILRITRIVDDTAQNFHARPSPDGSQVAFDSNRDGERGVYVANADGSNVRRVSGDGFAAVPSWSPDGHSLAFVRAEPDRPNVWNLWTLELASGELRRLTSYRYGQPWGGSWFPDGKRLAYSHEDRLVVLDLESGNERVYTSPRKGRLLRTPAVSPDGRKIIFQVHRDGAWLLDVEDGSMRKVLADPSAEEYAWSPDGRRVAYHSRRSGTWGVWLMSGR